MESFKATKFSSVLGLDLSAEAVRIASRYVTNNVLFQVGDMVAFQCPRDYDVILFSESLCYAPLSQQDGLLKKLAGHLKPGGAIVVTLAQAKRYNSIIELIRHRFQVVEERKFANSERHCWCSVEESGK